MPCVIDLMTEFYKITVFGLCRTIPRKLKGIFRVFWKLESGRLRKMTLFSIYLSCFKLLK